MTRRVESSPTSTEYTRPIASCIPESIISITSTTTTPSSSMSRQRSSNGGGRGIEGIGQGGGLSGTTLVPSATVTAAAGGGGGAGGVRVGGTGGGFGGGGTIGVGGRNAGEPVGMGRRGTTSQCHPMMAMSSPRLPIVSCFIPGLSRSFSEDSRVDPAVMVIQPGGETKTYVQALPASKVMADFPGMVVAWNKAEDARGYLSEEMMSEDDFLFPGRTYYLHNPMVKSSQASKTPIAAILSDIPRSQTPRSANMKFKGAMKKVRGRRRKVNNSVCSDSEFNFDGPDLSAGEREREKERDARERVQSTVLSHIARRPHSADAASFRFITPRLVPDAENLAASNPSPSSVGNGELFAGGDAVVDGFAGGRPLSEHGARGGKERRERRDLTWSLRGSEDNEDDDLFALRPELLMMEKKVTSDVLERMRTSRHVSDALFDHFLWSTDVDLMKDEQGWKWRSNSGRGGQELDLSDAVMSTNSKNSSNSSPSQYGEKEEDEEEEEDEMGDLGEMEEDGVDARGGVRSEGEDVGRSLRREKGSSRRVSRRDGTEFSFSSGEGTGESRRRRRIGNERRKAGVKLGLKKGVEKKGKKMESSPEKEQEQVTKTKKTFTRPPKLELGNLSETLTDPSPRQPKTPRGGRRKNSRDFSEDELNLILGAFLSTPKGSKKLLPTPILPDPHSTEPFTPTLGISRDSGGGGGKATNFFRSGSASSKRERKREKGPLTPTLVMTTIFKLKSNDDEAKNGLGGAGGNGADRGKNGREDVAIGAPLESRENRGLRMEEEGLKGGNQEPMRGEDGPVDRDRYLMMMKSRNLFWRPTLPQVTEEYEESGSEKSRSLRRVLTSNW